MLYHFGVGFFRVNLNQITFHKLKKTDPVCSSSVEYVWRCSVVCVCRGGVESKKGHPRHASNWNYLKSLYLNVFPSRNIALKMAFLPKYMGLQLLTTLDFNIILIILINENIWSSSIPKWMLQQFLNTSSFICSMCSAAIFSSPCYCGAVSMLIKAMMHYSTFIIIAAPKTTSCSYSW